MDGAESVRSGRSERSHRSHHSHRHRHEHDSHRPHRKHHRHRSERPDSSSSRLPDENRSVSIRLPTNEDMQHLTKHDQVSVQILPQDDNWGDNTTAMTSETGWSDADDVKMATTEAMENSVGLRCTRHIGAAFSGILSVVAFLSPPAMVTVPKVVPSITNKLKDSDCLTACEGYFISFAFKLLVLAIGSWALFFRRQKANMPRVLVFRAILLCLLFILTFAYWLFYVVKILMVEKAISTYSDVVQFASTMVDSLLFLHYITIILIEIRQLQPMYCIKIIRSPDGESRTYNIGVLSVQRAAVSCLEWYYRDFSVYNPYLENAIHRKSNKASQSNMSATKFKVYDVDGPIGGPASGDAAESKSKAIFAAAARRRDSGHNERYYEEQEYSTRVAKRRTRLITAAEESFSHIKRLRDDSGPALPMDSMEAAQAIFPSMARALQKYLRITRQQPAYPVTTIHEHLSRCVSQDMSPKSFLEEFLTPGSVINHPKQTTDMESWSLVGENLSRSIDAGTQFVLKKSDISLLCIVKRIPYFNLTEQLADSKEHQFVLRLNSETSV